MMRYEDQLNARKKSLEALMGAMDEDEAQRIPGITIEILAGDPGAGPMPEGIGEQGDPDGSGGEMGEDASLSTFEQLLKRKKMEQMKNAY